MVIVNYLGIPLSGQVSRLAATHYRFLRSYGPNDGLTRVTDAVAPGSLTLLAPGRDHFLAQDPEIGVRAEALMRLMLDLVAHRITGGCTPDRLERLRELHSLSK